MKLFLQKNEKIFERWGLRPQTPVPPAAEGFAPQTPIGLWRLGPPPPDPQNGPPLRISGYASARVSSNFWKEAKMECLKQRLL